MVSSKHAMVLLLCLMVFGLMAGATQASLVEIYGTDPGAKSTDPRPNSNGAAALFDAAAAAIGPENIITFEAAPLGPAVNLGVAPGVTLNVAQVPFAIRGIVNANPYTPANGYYGYGPDSLYGYNTTEGGSKFLSLAGGQAVFTFSQPIEFFGAYITGAAI